MNKKRKVIVRATSSAKGAARRETAEKKYDKETKVVMKKEKIIKEDNE